MDLMALRDVSFGCNSPFCVIVVVGTAAAAVIIDGGDDDDVTCDAFQVSARQNQECLPPQAKLIKNEPWTEIFSDQQFSSNFTDAAFQLFDELWFFKSWLFPLNMHGYYFLTGYHKKTLTMFIVSDNEYGYVSSL